MIYDICFDTLMPRVSVHLNHFPLVCRGTRHTTHTHTRIHTSHVPVRAYDLSAGEAPPHTRFAHFVRNIIFFVFVSRNLKVTATQSVTRERKRERTPRTHAHTILLGTFPYNSVNTDPCGGGKLWVRCVRVFVFLGKKKIIIYVFWSARFFEKK